MIWRRALLLGLAFTTGLLLETTIFGTTTLGGSHPELVLLVVVSMAMEDGAAVGAVAGFIGGLATDLLLNLPRGMSAFVFTAVGYMVGALREQYSSRTAWTPMAVVGMATLLAVFSYAGVGVLFGLSGFSFALVARRAALSAAYTVLLAPFVIPLVRKLAGKLRPRTVVRMTGSASR